VGVALFDTSMALAPLHDQLRAAIDRVLASGRFILGPEVEAFEREFASYLGAAHGVGVANGTEAITIALRAMGVGPGDDVIVPSFTFYASAEAIPPTGARPVFCDVDPATYCVTAETVRAALTPSTKAVIAVHLFGNVAPVGEIEALGVPVLEDAAQAAGSRSPAGRPGSLGSAATFSFYPSKNLACFGDGGMITTSDAGIAQRARTLRFHGSTDKVSYEQVGYNSRLDELQAAILRVALPHLDEWSEGRHTAGESYQRAGLGELAALPEPLPGASPAWHLYVISHPEVDRLQDALAAASIGCRAYYRTPVHRQPAMRAWGAGAELPGTDQAAARHLAIPMGPTLRADQAEEVVAAVRAASQPLRPASASS
jgi:dTDP-3-amino-3,4,6-trideoxy-alpha-D-glucose transaminase